MEPNDELCLCFHVTRRKVENYIRIEKPRRAAQLSQCYGAGTGCGWCRPFLERLFLAAQQDSTQAALPAADDYAAQRGDYVRSGGGTPPSGATPGPTRSKYHNLASEWRFIAVEWDSWICAKTPEGGALACRLKFPMLQV